MDDRNFNSQENESFKEQLLTCLVYQDNEEKP